MRIGVVNDVAAAVEALRRVVLSTHQHQIAWVAGDGMEAVEFCARDIPDVILMDMVMPRMDGVEATRRIMSHTPCPILVVTASVGKNAAKVFEALGAGALDVVNTPVVSEVGSRSFPQPLLAKLDTIRRLTESLCPPSRSGSTGGRGERGIGNLEALIGIGASAGGPSALAMVLPRLPADIAAAVIVVQHVDARLAPSLARWLGAQCHLPVRVAREGDRPSPGTILLAGRDAHLEFASPTRLVYSAPSTHSISCPSIDAFFHSANRFWPGRIIGVLLTGMGRDGAEGLRALRMNGHHTIAQDRSSSTVYGMPAAAAQLGAASEILRLDKIGLRLRNMVGQKT